MQVLRRIKQGQQSDRFWLGPISKADPNKIAKLQKVPVRPPLNSFAAHSLPFAKAQTAGYLLRLMGISSLIVRAQEWAMLVSCFVSEDNAKTVLDTKALFSSVLRCVSPVHSLQYAHCSLSLKHGLRADELIWIGSTATQTSASM